MGQSSGYVEEIRFEMNGHKVVAWLPPTHRIGESHLHPVQPRTRYWVIEIDENGACFQGPAYHPYEVGQELLAKAIVRDFLRHDVRMAPKRTE